MKTRDRHNIQSNAGRTWITAICFVSVCVAIVSLFALRATSQEAKEVANVSQTDKASGKVVGIKYNCVHVLKLEKTLRLYREILGFKLVGVEVLRPYDKALRKVVGGLSMNTQA